MRVVKRLGRSALLARLELRGGWKAKQAVGETGRARWCGTHGASHYRYFYVGEHRYVLCLNSKCGRLLRFGNGGTWVELVDELPKGAEEQAE